MVRQKAWITLRRLGVALITLSTLSVLQACSQSNFVNKRYSFPIPIEEPPFVAMQDQAEEQAKEQQRMLADPYGGGITLTVDLSKIGDHEWCYPLPGAKVISNYGARGSCGHSGIDLKTHPNDTIRAVFDGIVTMSEVFAGYGNCIILRHANGLETLYSHNSQNLVCHGQRVKAGQKIALTGRTGRATTEHLHFEMRVAGKHYNPNYLFDHNSRKLRKNLLIFTKNGGLSIQ